MILISTFEIVGTIAFAISGALIGIEKKLAIADAVLFKPLNSALLLHKSMIKLTYIQILERRNL